MADVIVPDARLIELRRKLSQAKTVAERTDIANQITALETTIAAQPSGSAVIEASKGGVSPSVATPESFKGKIVLSPSITENVYSAVKYDPVTGKAIDITQTDGKKTYYDAKGNPISSADFAQTAEGKKMAAAGYDIGYGAGKIGPGATDYATGYKAPGTTDYNVMMGLDPLTGQPIEEVKAGRVKYTDPRSGKVVTTDASGKLVFADGTPYTGSSTALTASTSAGMTQAQADRQSAYDLLFAQFKLYGLESLVEPLKGLITQNISPSEFTIRLRDTDAYKQRFSANQARINAGLRALSEAEYITLEDQYQDVMRRYGLPQSYYTRGALGKQEGFDKFISGDVSPAELEDRIQTAQNRVINAAPEVSTALKQFYPDITNGEILAYALDPNKAIEEIKRKVTAAEIGAGAMQAGLSTGATRAEELAKFGITGQAARQGYQTIASFLPRASQLSDIYKQGPYTQTIAESEVFGTTGAVEAEKRRKQLTELETAQFSGKTGAIGTALGRERAGQF